MRDGVLVPNLTSRGHAAGDGFFVPRDWTPGATVRIGDLEAVAPARPECVGLFSVDLGDVSSLVSKGVATPGTSMAWSPDGSRLAIGSYRGEVIVVDGWTGAIKARRSLAETMIKRVAWSADGSVVYASEQSPDAFVYALERGDLATRWTFRLADDLESSPPPPAEDVYGVFTLPAAYGLTVLEDGDLLVVGTHAWPVGADEKRNRARVYRLGPDGAVKATFPADGPAVASFRHPQIDEEAGRISFPVNHTATAPPTPGLPVHGVQVLALADLTPVGSHVPEPLAPHFSRTSMWEAIDVHGDRVLAGYGDGRLQVVPFTGGETITHDLGTPIVSGGVPVAASVGWGVFLPDGGTAASTGRSNIPWGSDVSASRPPTAHPGENTLWVHGPDGKLAWTWHGEPTIQGISVTPDGRHLVLGGGIRESDDRRDLFGATVFRLHGDGSGADRLLASCPTDAPVFFAHAVTDDGRIAVAEVPFKDGQSERVLGAYRVTVLR